MNTRHSKPKFCLQNTRGVNVANLCRSDYIRFSKRDHDLGLRITATTFGFRDREEKMIRLVNEFHFGNIKITATWLDNVHIVKLSSSIGKMIVRPKLINIRLSIADKLIDASLPCELLKKMVREINKKINDSELEVDHIEIDQFEMLKKKNIIARPDLIFEKLLNYADTRTLMSANDVSFKREIPTDILMVITVVKQIGPREQLVDF